MTRLSFAAFLLAGTGIIKDFSRQSKKVDLSAISILPEIPENLVRRIYNLILSCTQPNPSFSFIGNLLPAPMPDTANAQLISSRNTFGIGLRKDLSNHRGIQRKA